MSLSSTCIMRPVFATVMNIIMMLVGCIGLVFLGVRDYPSVDPPIISVSTSFPGANADVIETQITEPLESAINGIPGIRSLTSQSRDGRSNITVESSSWRSTWRRLLTMSGIKFPERCAVCRKMWILRP